MLEVPQLNREVDETSTPELPREVLGGVLEHMSVAADLGQVEVIEQLAATKQVDDIAQAVEVRRGAQQHAPRPQQHPQAPKCDMTGDRQMLDHLGEEDRVEAPVRGRILQRQIPLKSVDPVRPQLGKAAILDVGDAPVVAPERYREERELTTPDVEDIKPLVGRLLREPPQERRVPAAVARVVWGPPASGPPGPSARTRGRSSSRLAAARSAPKRDAGAHAWTALFAARPAWYPMRAEIITATSSGCIEPTKAGTVASAIGSGPQWLWQSIESSGMTGADAPSTPSTNTP